MWLTMGCWVLAVLSGLCWARWWTGAFTALTMLSFLWTQAGALEGWSGWLQFATLAVTPWLLAAQQGRDEQRLRHLHAEEARRLAQLSESARRLLGLQTETQQMERQITELGDVYHVTKETARALHLSELFAITLELAPRLLTAQGLRLIDLSGSSPHVLRALRAGDGRFVPSQGGPPEEVEQAVIQQALAASRPERTGRDRIPALPGSPLASVAWAPLWREQKTIGLLVADDLPEPQLKTLALVANQLSLQLSRIQLYQRVESLAVTDALTGLYVRSYFFERAREELVRCIRHKLSCSLLMIDLDTFKQKNDTYGHLVGDVVLRDVAKLLQRNLREVDLLARYGGEEFIMLLIETDAEQALPVAQRLKQLVEVHPIRAYDELLTQTVSIGLAAFPQDGPGLETLIERADQALYAAKRAGRNRVIRWTNALQAAGADA